MKIAETYTIRLCNNGEKFYEMQNVAERLFCRRPWTGDVIDGRWTVVGVRLESTREVHIIDVRPLPEQPCNF